MSVDGESAALRSSPAHRYVPALDGIRGLAVIGVLLFHAGFLTGGYLGVDAFFVLSGFLITGLLLEEVSTTGRVALGAFWGRRMRRLLPALLGVVVGVAAYVLFVAEASELDRIRGDALATLAYVANWRAILQDHGYWAMFETPSPLEHTWSLAIEEQFYVLWPLLVAGVAWLLTRPLRWVGRPGAAGVRLARVLFVGSLVGALASTAAMWRFYTPGADPSRVYMGTDTRAAGILAGVALAAWVAWRGRPARGWTVPRVGLEAVAAAAVVALAAAWVVIDGQRPGLYRGGFLFLGVAVVTVLAAASHPVEGPIARAASWMPLRWIGKLSYGIYLWHWPIYLVLDEQRTGLDDAPLLAVRLAATGVFAVASYVAIETPVRSGRLRTLRLPVVVPAAIVTCAGVLVLVTAGAPTRATLSSLSASRADGLAAPEGAANGKQRLLIVGDSVANSLASGARAIRASLDAVVSNGAVNGCALNADITQLQVLKRGGIIEDTELNPACIPAWLDAFERFQPDIVTVVFGNAAGFERFRLHGEWVGPCDTAYARWYRNQMDDVVATFRAKGAAVVFTELPYQIGEWLPTDARARLDCMNALNRAVATSPGGLPTIDLNGFVCPADRCIVEHDGEAVRPDGLHFGRPIDGDPKNGFEGAGTEWAARWLVAEAARAVSAFRPTDGSDH